MLTAVARNLVGAAEIGRLLGVSRQRVQQLIKTPDWPRPEAELDMGKVWNRDDIMAWARRHGRLGPGSDE